MVINCSEADTDEEIA